MSIASVVVLPAPAMPQTSTSPLRNRTTRLARSVGKLAQRKSGIAARNHAKAGADAAAGQKVVGAEAVSAPPTLTWQAKSMFARGGSAR